MARRVRVRVGRRDGPGAPDTDPPVASFTATPSSAATGDTVTFDASASTGDDLRYYFDAVLDPNDPDATPFNEFEIGEADEGTGVLEFAFSTEGDKHVRLTVVDTFGRTDDTVQTVVISGEATEPQSAPSVDGNVVDDGRVDWSWNLVDGADYSERRRRIDDGTWTDWEDVGTDTSWVDDGHTAGTKLDLEVVGCNAQGCGPVGSATRITGESGPGDTGDFDPALYPFPILFPTDPDSVGIAGVGLTEGDLRTFSNNGSLATLRFRPDGSLRNDYGLVSNPSAAGTEADPFYVDEANFVGEIHVSGNNGNLWVIFRRCLLRIPGNRDYGVLGIQGARIAFEDCTIGSPGPIHLQAGIAGSRIPWIRRCRMMHSNDNIKINRGLVEDCYLTNDVTTWNGVEYTHTDNIQDNQGSTMDVIVRRTFCDNWVLHVGGPQDGNYRGGNANHQNKPQTGDNSHHWTVEDSYLGRANNYTLNYGHNDVQTPGGSHFIARRLIVETADNRDDWVAGGSNGIRTEEPGNATYDITEIYLRDGTDVS